MVYGRIVGCTALDEDGARSLDLTPSFTMEHELRKANWKDTILCFGGRRGAFLVQGDSMLPTLKAGETVLIDPKASIQKDDIVLANHPYKKSVRIIKRVRSMEASNNIVLVGDNTAESTDSRTLGEFKAGDILGKVIAKAK